MLAEPETGIEMILTESVSEYNVLKIDYINSEEGMDGMAYLDELNWNIEPHFEGKFFEHFISQAIHDLYDHMYWSFFDILKINQLCTEMRVVYQNFAGTG